MEEAQRFVEQRAFTALFEVSSSGLDFIRYVGAYENDLGLEYGFQLGLVLGKSALACPRIKRSPSRCWNSAS